MEPAVVFAEQAGSSVQWGTGVTGGCAPKRLPLAPASACTAHASPFPLPPPPPRPQVMVSNPHSLGLQAVIYEDGYTYDGNTKHRLVSSLSRTRPAYPSPHPHQTRIFRLRGSALTCRCQGSPDDVLQGLTSVPYKHSDQVPQSMKKPLPLPHLGR